MRTFLTPLITLGLCLHVQAEALNATGLISALLDAGLGSMAHALERANQTKVGQDLINALVDGSSNHTVFAPNNAAFDAPGISAISNNPPVLASILSYHVLPGNFTNSSKASPELVSATRPSVTLGRTLLTNDTLVHLEGNKAQVLAWTRNDTSSNPTFLNQIPEITVLSTITVGNLLIATISGVLAPPRAFSVVAAANHLAALGGVVDIVAVPNFFSNGTNATIEQAIEANRTRGFTFFAPDDTALKNAESTLTGLVNNQTALLALLSNHYINGTSYYSPLLTASTSEFVSAAGESLTFSTNSSGTFVTSTNGASAKIVRTDALVNNGVVHVVDHVLVNLNRDDAKASSAYQSATSAANQHPKETGPIGPTSTSNSGSGVTGAGNNALAVGVASAGGAMVVGALGWIMFMGFVIQ